MGEYKVLITTSGSTTIANDLTRGTKHFDTTVAADEDDNTDTTSIHEGGWHHGRWETASSYHITSQHHHTATEATHTAASHCRRRREYTVDMFLVAKRFVGEGVVCAQ